MTETMLTIAFIDPIEWVYDPETPYRRPLGGSQSALCYLAAALAERGHRVLLLQTSQPAPRLVRGVLCAPLYDPPPAFAGKIDAAIILNAAVPFEHIEALRGYVRPDAARILWQQLDHERGPVAPLRNPASRDYWTGLAMVSRWQAQCYQSMFGVDPARIRILRNAVSPLCEGRFAPDRPIVPDKPWPPVFCYTSAPFRGLDRLLVAFPIIRAAIPGARLRVFSGTGVYQADPKDDPWHALYEAARAEPGVDYVGSVSQTELAAALSEATALTYPNTFPETSCIAVIEALAAGCEVFTSDLGALRETCGGFGDLIPPFGRPYDHVTRFAQRVIDRMAERRADPAGTEARLRAAVNWANRELTWSRRAAEWEAWLAELCGKER